MIKCSIISILMMIFFELLGQAIISSLKLKHNSFNFFIGFASYLAILYVSSYFFTSRNCSFLLVVIINFILFILSLALIIKQRDDLKISFNCFDLIVIILMSYVSLYFSYNTTLGDLHGFDSTFYLNFVVGVVENTDVNKFHILYGYNDYTRAVTESYFYQSYFYFCATIIYLAAKVFNILKIDYLYSTIYIWVFQIIFTTSLMSVFVNGMNRYLKGKYILSVLLGMFFVLGYSKIYWNSVYGFYGNTFRIVSLSYLTMYILDYLNNPSKELMIMLSLLLLGGCAFSSSVCFIAFFMVFGLFVIELKNNKNIIKWILITLFVPTINIFSIVTERGPKTSTTVVFACFAVIWLCQKYIFNILSTKYAKSSFVFVIAFVMFVLSYKITGNILDFSGIFNNLSQSADMTLDYFHGGIYNNTKLVLSIVTAAYLLVFYKDKYVMFCWVLILCFFNPFCCNFINKFIVVYYRAYELIINPLLIMYYYSKFHDLLNIKYLSLGLEIIVFILALNNDLYKRPYYYHQTFETDSYDLEFEGYDYVNKMSPLKTDILLELKNIITDNGLNNPYIITGDIRTFSAIHSGHYIYGREYFIDNFSSKADEYVYKIFKPYEYYGQYDYDVDYSKAYEYLQEANVDILVLDKEMLYHDLDTDEYYSMMYLINRSVYPNYENERYCIYLINH